MSDLVGNRENSFSRDTAHLFLYRVLDYNVLNTYNVLSTTYVMSVSETVDPVSASGCASWRAFESSSVRFPGPAHSLTSCQLLVEGLSLGTG